MQVDELIWSYKQKPGSLPCRLGVAVPAPKEINEEHEEDLAKETRPARYSGKKRRKQPGQGVEEMLIVNLEREP